MIYNPDGLSAHCDSCIVSFSGSNKEEILKFGGEHKCSAPVRVRKGNWTPGEPNTSYFNHPYVANTGLREREFSHADIRFLLNNSIICGTSAAIITMPSGRKLAADTFILARQYFQGRRNAGAYADIMKETVDHLPTHLSITSKGIVELQSNSSYQPKIKTTYNDLYWDYIHATTEQSAHDALQALISAVNLEMQPGNGSWCTSVDPKAPKTTVVEQKKSTSSNVMAFKKTFIPSIYFWSILITILHFLGVLH